MISWAFFGGDFKEILDFMDDSNSCYLTPGFLGLFLFFENIHFHREWRVDY